MKETEVLDLIQHYKWRIEPLVYGGWCIDILTEREGYIRLCLTPEPSLRDAIQQAMRRQRRLALEALASTDV